MDDGLQATLRDLLQENAGSNVVLERLTADYAAYHLILVIVGGAFLLVIGVLSVLSWIGFARARRRPHWSTERWIYLGFGLLGAAVTGFLLLILTANISTVLQPRAGFSGAIGLLGNPRPGSHADALQSAFVQWLTSREVDVPPLVQEAIDQRLAWQFPKAVICVVLLCALMVATVAVWRRVIQRSRIGISRPIVTSALACAGATLVVADLLLMLMVMGNVQASVVPMAMVIFYG
ncbi:MAG: hypothetical protein PSX37_03905 [bacterium]|nr:hypothetical protein [bacterium]